MAALKAHLQERVPDFVANGWCQILPSGDICFKDGHDEPESWTDVSPDIEVSEICISSI